MNEPARIDDLALLAEFAQLAMGHARAASARAGKAEAEGADPTAHLVAFDRMGRAMRLALSLRRRFMGEAEAGAARRVEAGKQRLKAALVPAIRLHADPIEQIRLQCVLDQRLETEADAFADMPLAAALASLRRTLGLPADEPVGELLEARPARGQDAPAERLGDRLAPDLVALARQVEAQATGPP